MLQCISEDIILRLQACRPVYKASVGTLDAAACLTLLPGATTQHSWGLLADTHTRQRMRTHLALAGVQTRRGCTLGCPELLQANKRISDDRKPSYAAVNADYCRGAPYIPSGWRAEHRTRVDQLVHTTAPAQQGGDTAKMSRKQRLSFIEV